MLPPAAAGAPPSEGAGDAADSQKKWRSLSESVPRADCGTPYSASSFRSTSALADGASTRRRPAGSPAATSGLREGEADLPPVALDVNRALEQARHALVLFRLVGSRVTNASPNAHCGGRRLQVG
eukprot:scaffold41187_cov303-Isochrysis_galbana.AAC.2